MKNNTKNTTKHLLLKIFIGTVIAASILYILMVIGRILLVFPNIEADMSRIEGYFLFAVFCCIIGFKSLIKINKKNMDQNKELEESSPTEEKQ